MFKMFIAAAIGLNLSGVAAAQAGLPERGPAAVSARAGVPAGKKAPKRDKFSEMMENSKSLGRGAAAPVYFDRDIDLYRKPAEPVKFTGRSAWEKIKLFKGAPRPLTRAADAAGQDGQTIPMPAQPEPVPPPAAADVEDICMLYCQWGLAPGEACACNSAPWEEPVRPWDEPVEIPMPCGLVCFNGFLTDDCGCVSLEEYFDQLPMPDTIASIPGRKYGAGQVMSGGSGRVNLAEDPALQKKLRFILRSYCDAYPDLAGALRPALQGGSPLITADRNFVYIRNNGRIMRLPGSAQYTRSGTGKKSGQAPLKGALEAADSVINAVDALISAGRP